MIYAFFNLGFGELFAIFVVVLLLFGADKIPEFARTLGKGIRYVKDATDGVKRDIQSQVDDVKSDVDINMQAVRRNFDVVDNAQKRMKQEVNDIVEDVADTVKNPVPKSSPKIKPKEDQT